MDFMKGISQEIEKEVIGVEVVEEKAKDIIPPENKAAVVLRDFNVDDVKIALTNYQNRLIDLTQQAKEFKVIDDDTKTKAVESMGMLRQLSKNLKSRQNVLLSKYEEYIKGVKGFIKSFVDPAEKEGINALKKSIGDYDTAQIIAKRKQDEEEAIARKKLQEELDKQADKAGVERVQLPDAPTNTEKEPMRTRSETGALLSTKLVWKGVIVDPDKVPRYYCTPDQKLINEAVKNGIREIAGVEIKEVPQSILRV